MDAGVAGMWYLVRRGSGIFYELGKAAFAPGKNAMVAMLLHELAIGAHHLDHAWRALALKRRLFRNRLPRMNETHRYSTNNSGHANGSLGALIDAQRIRATANGSRICEAVGVRWCRCRFILSDEWDAPMVWLARALGYETLVLTATLLPRGTCQHPLEDGSAEVIDDEAPTFATAYPELVDVRPLEKWTPSEDGTRPLVHDAQRQPVNLGAHTMRKQPSIADAWLAQMKTERRLSVRNPLEPDDESNAAPCNFSVHARLLQCAAHVSANWLVGRARSACGVVMCVQTP